MASSQFSTSLCTDADFPAAIKVLFAALGGNLFDLTFPNWRDPEKLAEYTSLLLHQSHSDPTHRWVKAVDNATGEIVGVSQWDVYRTRDEMPKEGQLVGPPSPGFLASWLRGPDEKIWKDRAEDKAFADDMATAIIAFRGQVMKEAKGPVVCLSLMAVSPDHQRRGIGKELMKWGMSMTDELNAEAIVEASRNGRGLYEKSGFVAVSEGNLELDEKWADRFKFFLVMMQRPAQK